MKFLPLTWLVLLFSSALMAQKYQGLVYDSQNNTTVAFVNIGIKDKNVGTVSDGIGKYQLWIDAKYLQDTIMVSCIGYYPLLIPVSDYIQLPNHNLFLQERTSEMKEVVVNARKYKQRTLGVTTTSRFIQAGFKENKLGYECGILMKVKKTAILERIIINFSSCTYDTIFYRINVYKDMGKMQFENQLKQPIFIKLPKSKVRENVIIDLMPYHIQVEGDFLLTMEQVKELGNGYLYFCAGMAQKTYFKATSQGRWEKAPVGISISVDAKVEK